MAVGIEARIGPTHYLQLTKAGLAAIEAQKNSIQNPCYSIIHEESTWPLGGKSINMWVLLH